MPYFDYAATSPMHPDVIEAMIPHLNNTWGNPSSPHSKGREARAAIDSSRRTVADLFGVKTHEVIFTASASEANSLAIFGMAESFESKNKKQGTILTIQLEHDCSLKAFDKLKERGWTIVMINVDTQGLIDLEMLREECQKENVAFVSVQWANNEVGTIQPVDAIQKICTENSVPYHCDAVQTIGHLPAPSPCTDLLSIAAHKFGGPKGVGLLIARESVSLKPQIIGGGQEHGLRGGTENTASIVGLAKALEIAIKEQPREHDRLLPLRNKIIDALTELGGTLNGPLENRLPNNVNMHFSGVDTENIVIELDLAGYQISTGSACSTGSAKPSHVLLGMGQTKTAAKERVRITLGRETTVEDVEGLIGEMRRIFDNF